MKKAQLAGVVNNIRKALETLEFAGIEDYRIVSKYSEYLVALKLTEVGHRIQIGSERENRKADIFLPDKELKVEVKSGKFNGAWYVASFANGKQIKQDKFDYCVFVTFDKHTPKEFLVFSRKELDEVANISRNNLARFKETNPCLLFRFKDWPQYKKYMDNWGGKMFQIEVDLHKHPEKYKERWGKIG